MTISGELIWLDRASAAIERAGTIGEAKAIVDRAAAIKVFAAKQKWGEQERARVVEIECRATARLGELLKQVEKDTGGRPSKTRSPREQVSRPRLEELGVTRKQSHVAQLVAEVPAREREQFITQHRNNGLSVTGLARVAKEARRESKRKTDRQRVADVPSVATVYTKHSTIVVDPPWDFGDKGDVDQLGRGRPDYATMPIEEIARLPIAELACDDAHLYLWITNRSLPKGFALMEAWGFRYVTCLTWCKPSVGMGNYFRGSTEQVLFGVRGSLPLKRKNVGTWFAAPRPERKHSAKPPEFYELVESCSPGPYIDVFARRDRDGWARWPDA